MFTKSPRVVWPKSITTRGNQTRSFLGSSTYIHRHRACCFSTWRWRSMPLLLAKPSPRTSSAQIHRSLFLDTLPTWLLPPVAFIGLFLTLWTYKCFMMVIFQDKIIYMPYVPPFSRAEKVEGYISQCQPVIWTTRQIRSLDGTKIAICSGSMPTTSEDIERSNEHIIICYFHGNGGSIPPRLPMLSAVLKRITNIQAEQGHHTRYTLVSLSYRGYWTSSGRASQLGIEQDAQATLDWIVQEHSTSKEPLQIIVWGQSIGAGVASTATARFLLQNENTKQALIIGLVLETPFSNIRSMLAAMYPQNWLPYGYLWPFLWNHWDSQAALASIAKSQTRPKIFLLPATKDEIVPATEVAKLEDLCKELELDMYRQDIIGALHTDATAKRVGQDAVARFILRCSTEMRSTNEPLNLGEPDSIRMRSSK